MEGLQKERGRYPFKVVSLPNTEYLLAFGCFPVVDMKVGWQTALWAPGSRGIEIAQAPVDPI